MNPPKNLVPLGLLLTSVAVVAMNQFTIPRGIAEQTKDHADINVRYARALSELAKHELQQALAENEKATGAFTNVTVERLKNNALIAEERLQHALSGKEHSLHQVHLREVEGNLRIAELNLQNALRLNERLSRMVSEDEMTGLRMSVEVARLALERAKDPAATKSREAHIEWQFDYLRHEMLRLQTRVAELETLARR